MKNHQNFPEIFGWIQCLYINSASSPWPSSRRHLCRRSGHPQSRRACQSWSSCRCRRRRRRRRRGGRGTAGPGPWPAPPGSSTRRSWTPPSLLYSCSCFDSLTRSRCYACCRMQSLQQATRSQYTCGAKPSWIMPGGQVWPPWLHVAGRGWPGTIWLARTLSSRGFFVGRGEIASGMGERNFLRWMGALPWRVWY